MTKDWDSVQAEIKELSVTQKKSLEEVKLLMERKFGFRASTRAYRMKLKEWGYMRHKPRKRNGNRREVVEERRQSENTPEAEGVIAGSPALEDVTFEAMEDTVPDAIAPDEVSADRNSPNVDANLPAESHNLLLPVDHWPSNQEIMTGPVMDVLDAVLIGDAQKAEQLLVKNPEHVNDPIGLLFDHRDSRFFNHPAIAKVDLIQHPDQKLLDIASGLPYGAIIWVLLAYGAVSTTTPLGTDIALYNAIKNERPYTVQSLLQPTRLNVNGNPGTCWRPLLHAVTRNCSNIVRILLDRGASPNDITSTPANTVLPSALGICLQRRENDYLNEAVREESNKILKLLLDAGANLDVPVIDVENNNSILTPWEIFINPWKTDPGWSVKLSAAELECLKIFLGKGPGLHAHFRPFACGSISSNTFAHQVLWHSTPDIARLVTDSASPSTPGSGSIILHEILGFCPDGKRHATETLRDIQVLLKRGGADPNGVDSKGITPLRKCIEQCPAVDIAARVRKLLDEGADPELEDQYGMQPFTLAASSFQEPLLSEVLHLLVSKFRGQYARSVNGKQRKWSSGYFPIPDDPDFRQSTSYCIQNGDFMSCLTYMVRGDIQSVFQRACSSVVTQKFLDAANAKASAVQPYRFTERERSEIQQILLMRQVGGFAEYKFSSNFVMSLLSARPAMSGFGSFSLSTTGNARNAAAPRSLSTSSDVGNLVDASAKLDDGNRTETNGSSSRPVRRLSVSSASSTDSVVSFFVPSTTQVRWPKVYQKEENVAEAKKYYDAVLKLACKTCNDGNLLTEKELERHGVEHAHSGSCTDATCQRRFCVRKPGE